MQRSSNHTLAQHQRDSAYAYGSGTGFSQAIETQIPEKHRFSGQIVVWEVAEEGARGGMLLRKRAGREGSGEETADALRCNLPLAAGGRLPARSDQLAESGVIERLQRLEAGLHLVGRAGGILNSDTQLVDVKAKVNWKQRRTLPANGS